LGRPLLEDRVAFDFIRYANCWEDADVLCLALQPCRGKRILSIASAGDNTLALLAEGAEVVAADLSAPQLACLELRCAAFRELDHRSVLAFLGVHKADDRLDTFGRLVQHLSPGAAAFWNQHRQLVDKGIVHGGKFEAYFRLFGRWLLPLIHSRQMREQLLVEKDRDARFAFWSKWNNRRWRLLFRIFFSRRLMGRLGRDPAFFQYVDGDVFEAFMNRAKHGLTELPTHKNPFLDYIVWGNFRHALPRYLRPEYFDAVRSGLGRLTIHHGSIAEAGSQHRQGGFDGFNLSDIFEYLSPTDSDQLYSDLFAIANPGARLAYWNTLVPRGRPDSLASQVRLLDELSRDLLSRDLAFFYGGFHVDEVQSATDAAAIGANHLSQGQ